jgi:hypothetical protein
LLLFIGAILESGEKVADLVAKIVLFFDNYFTLTASSMALSSTTLDDKR